MTDEVSQEVDSRGEAMRSEIAKKVIFEEKRVGGRARVTTDEDRVLRGVCRESKSYR